MAHSQTPIIVTLSGKRSLREAFENLRGAGKLSSSDSLRKILSTLQAKPRNGRLSIDQNSRVLLIPPLACKYELHKIVLEKRILEVVVAVEFHTVADYHQRRE